MDVTLNSDLASILPKTYLLPPLFTMTHIIHKDIFFFSIFSSFIEV